MHAHTHTHTHSACMTALDCRLSIERTELSEQNQYNNVSIAAQNRTFQAIDIGQTFYS